MIRAKGDPACQIAESSDSEAQNGPLKFIARLYLMVNKFI